MNNTDQLIHTKLRLPFTRPDLVNRPRLQVSLSEGLSRPLTLVTAPAGFGKTTLVASSIAACGMLVAWLSLDKDDNQVERFLKYLVAAVQEADRTIGNEAAQLLRAARQALPEAVLTSLINDLDTTGREMALVLDDYQFISNQAVHQGVTFLLTHCPRNFHLLIATRSDPPMPLARWQGRGQMVELRLADLRFSEPEAAQFLNDIMGLDLDTGSVTALAERTEGWIAGLQMAALSMRDREDVRGFIEGFSGTNRYILDFLLEEVLASQPPEIQHFLLHTSILERLTAPLCEAMLPGERLEDWVIDEITTDFQPFNLQNCQSILEYLDRANLFLVPLDDQRVWYRYHHLFADLLRAQLQRSLGAPVVAQLHIRASEWLGKNGSLLEAIHHASLASDDERVERLIEQNYMEMVSRGEQSGMRFWKGKLSEELVYRRPWLCIYEAMSHSWFGELDEAEQLLAQVEKHIQSENPPPDAPSMLAHLIYIKSRITAMRGDLQQAIELCLAAREHAPADNLALQLDCRITLGYEYFLAGDYPNASPILNETIRKGITAGAVINTVAAACLVARMYAVQGQLHKSYDIYQMAAQSIPETSGQHLGSRALVEVGLAEVYYEWNDLEAALAHVKQGLAWLPYWDKADDLALTYITLARIHLAQAQRSDYREAVAKAIQLIQTRGVFSEARQAVEIAQVKLWLAQGDLQAASHWAASRAEHHGSGDRFTFENELAHIAQARVLIAERKPDKAIDLSSYLEASARSSDRQGRLIEILILKALALQAIGDSGQAQIALTNSLELAKPGGYLRIFLDEGQPMQLLLARWLARAGANPCRDYASQLLSQFDAGSQDVTITQEKASPTSDLSACSGQVVGEPEVRPVQDMLVEPLSQRELEVLHLIAQGKTNQEVAQHLIVAPGTVKAHTASIYRKLDVANRTEAVACARQLGILP